MTSLQIPEDIAERIKHHAEQRGQAPEHILRDMLNQYEAKSAPLPFREVVESTLLSCIIVDAQQPDNPIIYANSAFEETTSYTQDDVIGHNCRFLQGNDRDQAGLEPLRNAIKNGDSCVVTLRNYRKDGTLFWNRLHIAPIYDAHDTLTHFIGFQQDVTDQVERQRELHKNRARLEGILNSQVDIVCRYTPDTTLTYVNDAYCDYFGESRDELLGTSFLRLGAPDQHPRILDRIEVVKRDPTPQVRIFSTTTSGTREWIQWVDYGITDDHGEVMEIQAVGRDITPLIEIQQQLEDQRERFATILNNIPVMIAQFNPDWQFEYVNPAFETVLGWDEKSLKSHSNVLREFFPHVEQHQEALDFMTSDQEGWRDFEMQSEDGATVVVTWKKEQLSDGGYICIGVDITQRKRIEEALRTSEYKFRTMLEMATEGILLVNSDGDIVLVNRYIEDKFQFPRGELLGSQVDMLLPGDVRSKHARLRQNYMQNPEERPMGADRELKARRRDGTTFPVEVSLTPIEIADEMHVMAFLVDITQRKQLETQRIHTHQLQADLAKERELRELKGRFVSIVSHEFRTPLSVIRTSVDLIDKYFDRLSKERVEDKLAGIREQVIHMATMLDEVLRLSKSETGKVEFSPEEISIVPFMNRVVETMRLTDTGDHVITVDCSAQTVQADSRLLDHILSNLISNALKYSPDQTTIAVTVTEDANGWRFEVSDQGIGIPEDDLPQLFEPFYRAGNVRDEMGTGLGMSIVKDYVEHHHGDITLESVEGEGTTVSVFIPN